MDHIIHLIHDRDFNISFHLPSLCLRRTAVLCSIYSLFTLICRLERGILKNCYYAPAVWRDEEISKRSHVTKSTVFEPTLPNQFIVYILYFIFPRLIFISIVFNERTNPNKLHLKFEKKKKKRRKIWVQSQQETIPLLQMVFRFISLSFLSFFLSGRYHI